MDERAAIDRAVRSRLSLLRMYVNEKIGPALVAELVGLGRIFPFVIAEQIQRIETAGTLIVRNLKQCHTFVLNEEESNTIIGSHATYGSTKADVSESLTPEGFVYFAKPIPDPTDSEPVYPIRAISWSVTAPEEAVMSLRGVPEMEDPYTLTMTVYTDLDNIEGVSAGDLPCQIYPIAYILWAMGVEGGGSLRHYTGRDERAPYIQVLLTFWALIQSRILDDENDEKPVEKSKKTSDRLKHARKHIPDLNTTVKVVRYRKRTSVGKANDRPSKSGRKVTVRYWKSPFWKWVWYPSLNDHRRRRIEPYQSGPVDAPEVGAERIFLPPKPPKEKPVHAKKEENA